MTAVPSGVGTVCSTRLVASTEFDGVISHAELDFGNGRLQLGVPSPEYQLVPPPTDGVCYSLALYCEDADAVAVALPARYRLTYRTLANDLSTLG